MIVLKNIEMTLDPASIDRAIREIQLFEEKLKPAMQCLIDYLGEKGVEIARAALLWVGGSNSGGGENGDEPEENPAYATGALSESIRYEKRGEIGVIDAGQGLTNAMGEPTNYAIFVEYGTGIYGADINGHGLEGWWYPAPWGWWEKNGKKYAWTNGMPPRPFMANTLLDLEDEAEVNGGRIIAEYIRGERA